MLRRVSKTFIKNIDEVKCIDCVHCIRVVSNESKFSCMKCGIKDLVTGSITYQDAGICRDNIYKCGNFGTYFEKKLK